jgi:hypothetical protein
MEIIFQSFGQSQLVKSRTPQYSFHWVSLAGLFLHHKNSARQNLFKKLNSSDKIIEKAQDFGPAFRLYACLSSTLAHWRTGALLSSIDMIKPVKNQ